jgi:uncharacterized SAM-binding protein YcdF (DUF218 family)
MRRLSRAAVAGLFGSLAIFVAGMIGLAHFATTIPRAAAVAFAPADAVVVLTGGVGRLDAGIALLDRGFGRRLFVSGVHPGVELNALLRQAPAVREGRDCCITLGHGALDTRGNAVETAAWAAGAGVKSLLLVTSNYHIERSLIEFRSAMPGIAVVPHPVPAPGIDFDNWWREPRIARLVLGEFVKLQLARLRTGFASWTRADPDQAR